MYIIAKVAWTIISNLPTIILVGALSAGAWKVWGIWQDAKDNREYKESVESTIEFQKDELDNRWALIQEREETIKELVARETALKEQLSESITQAEEDKKELEEDKEQLERLSEQTRFGKTEDDENTLLSRTMQRGTDKVFRQLEEITE